MYATDFEYDGKTLSDYNLVICSFDGAENGSMMSGANITFNQIRSATSNNFMLYSSTYQEAFTTVIHIMKDPCIYDKQEDLYLKPEEISEIQRWLCRKEYHEFRLINNGKSTNYHVNATFSSNTMLLGGEVVGLELTLYSDAPYAYNDVLVYNFSLEDSSQYEFNDVSDEVGYIIPDMKITVKEFGELQIWNDMDTSRKLIIKNCAQDEDIFIDGKRLMINSSIGSHNLGRDFNFIFPRVINTYDNRKNTFKSNLTCEVELSYYPIIKVGM